MRRHLGICALLVCAGFVASASAADIQSGRAVGEITPSFVVLDVTGPHKGEPICYVCEYKGAPTIIAFFQDANAQAADMLVKLNDLSRREENLKVVGVVMAGPDAKEAVAQMAQERGITVPLTVFRAGKTDRAMKLYKLNPDASNTILVSTKRRVTANLTDVTTGQFARVEQAAVAALK